jgi:hypothetical protein
MRYGGGFRALAALLLLGFIGLITAGAYGAGFATGRGSGIVTTPAWAYGGAFGAGHVIGFLVTIFVLIVIFRLFMIAAFGHRRRVWGHHGYWRGEGDAASFGPGFGPDFGPDFGPGSRPGGPMGGPGGDRPGFGPGGWHRSEWREVGQSYFDEFHRHAHGEVPPAPGSTPTPPPAG